MEFICYTSTIELFVCDRSFISRYLCNSKSMIRSCFNKLIKKAREWINLLKQPFLRYFNRFRHFKSILLSIHRRLINFRKPTAFLTKNQWISVMDNTRWRGLYYLREVLRAKPKDLLSGNKSQARGCII